MAAPTGGELLSRPDVPTVMAVGAVVYVGAKLVHEAVGHGGACVVTGGEWVAVSSAWSDCDRTGLTVTDMRVGQAAGTVLNLVVAVLAGIWLRLRPPTSGAPRLALFLTLAVNGFLGGGYLLVDPIFRFGDGAAFLEGLSPGWLWRGGATVLGLILSVATLQLCRRELEAFLGPGAAEDRRPIARWLCLGPYLAAGGVLLTGGALLNELGMAFAISSALATLGGTCWLAWLPSFVHERSGGAPAVPVAYSGLWLALGVLAVVFELAAFGPGLRWG